MLSSAERCNTQLTKTPAHTDQHAGGFPNESLLINGEDIDFTNEISNYKIARAWFYTEIIELRDCIPTSVAGCSFHHVLLRKGSLLSLASAEDSDRRRYGLSWRERKRRGGGGILDHWITVVRFLNE